MGYNIKIIYIIQDPRVAWQFTLAREKVEHRAIDKNVRVDDIDNLMKIYYNKKTLEFTSYRVDSAGNPVNITYFPMTRDGWEANKDPKRHPHKETLTPEKDAKPL